MLKHRPMARRMLLLLGFNFLLVACTAEGDYTSEDEYTEAGNGADFGEGGQEASYSFADYESVDGQEDYGGEENSDREPFDEDAAREAAEDEVASDSYLGSGSPYGCTIDCSGHEAGFAWRRDNGYVTYGKSQSFYEGAQAFEDAVDERVEEMRDNYDGGLDPEY